MAMSIAERGMRAKMRQFLQEHYRTFICKKVMRIVDSFKTVSEFCEADETQWLTAYRSARPESQVDLGKRCKMAIDDVIAYVKDEVRADKLAAEERRLASERKAEEERKREEERVLKEARENPKFTLAELKSNVAFMELCNVSAVDLKGVKQFMSVIDVQTKEQ